MRIDVTTFINLVGQLGGDHKGALQALRDKDYVDSGSDADLMERFGVDPRMLDAGAYEARLEEQRKEGFGGYDPNRDLFDQVVRFDMPMAVEVERFGEDGAEVSVNGRPAVADRSLSAELGGRRPVAVITGASAGVGRAAAVKFAKHGFDVALLARGWHGLRAAADEVEAAGGAAMPISVDVSEYHQVEEAAAAVQRAWGPIDVWVNDAMSTVFSTFDETKPQDFKRALEVTFLGQVWGTKVALKVMKPRNAGSIVNVGSALAFIGIPLQAAYCASKFACRGFFESVRAELLHEKSAVTISMVHLPGVNTPQFDWSMANVSDDPMPVPPIYQPEVCARFIVDTALHPRRAKVIGSWNKILIMTANFFPGLANQYASRGAWGTQMTNTPLSSGRPVNLWQPADSDTDHGAHGRFDAQAGGMLDPSFLASLPKTAKTFMKALQATLAEKKPGLERRKLTGAVGSSVSTGVTAAKHLLPGSSKIAKAH